MQDVLAVYGSLAPGEENHWVVKRIAGEWERGEVRGYRFEITWGPAEGYDGFVPDPDGHRVPVWLLRSEQLEDRWFQIDDFEGPGYERRSIEAIGEDSGPIQAQIYVTLSDV